MKQFFFYAFFWLLSASLNATDTAETGLSQRFSKAHVETAVTKAASVRLKEIDVLHPLFIFK